MFATQLWIPILVATVLVFVASSLIHMVFKWHKSDFRALPNEDEVRNALRASNAPAGAYVTPHCPDMKAMATPEMQKKFIDGPVGHITLLAPGVPSMGRPLGLWFAYCLVTSVLAAYLAARTLPPEASFGQVLRVTGLLSFLTYAAGSVQAGIWMGKPWPAVAKDLLDGLIYGAITGGVFGWLWPR